MAQPIVPLYPPNIPEGTRYVLQIKVIEIDGTKAALTQYRGFRRYVESVCTGFGLSGFVWRTPHVHGKILARGFPIQLDRLLEFVKELRVNHFIKGFGIENKQDFLISDNAFIVHPSTRPRVHTGDYSDPDLDDVVSTSSLDDIPVLGSPSVHDK
jgi:hypothetical protein